MSERVYRILPNARAQNGPFLDFRIAKNVKDWNKLLPILNGERSARNYRIEEFVVKRKDACDWHYYLLSGSCGLISERLAEILGDAVKVCFELLPAKINDCSYRLLRHVATIDCLDAEASDALFAEDEPGKIMEIYRHAIRKDMLPDPCFFVMPQLPHFVYATQSVKRDVEAAKLKGLYFIDAEVWFDAITYSYEKPSE
ncbi:MAG TPA: DUF1629 domain-containing protein [Pirellulaceae bacterium]|jgi:hypothetical protein|nr:DUF1629 domain-containing protein [Pirellulaceae bacterium]